MNDGERADYRDLEKRQQEHLVKYRNDPKMRLVEVGESIKTGDTVVTCGGPMLADSSMDGEKITANGPAYPYGYYFRRAKEDSGAT